MKIQVHKIEKALHNSNLVTFMLLLLACLMLSTFGAEIHTVFQAIAGKGVAK